MVAAYFLVVEAYLVGEVDKRSLGGVADVGAVLAAGVVAEHRRDYQLTLVDVVDVNAGFLYPVAVRYYPADGHLVLCEGACLVRADDRYRAQTLYRLKLSHDGVFLGHLLSAEGEDDGDYRAERLGYCRYGEGYGEHQRIHYHVAVDVLEVAAGIVEREPEHQRTDDEYAYGELFAEGVKGSLKGSLALVGVLYHGGYLAHLGVHADVGDDELAASVGDKASRVYHVLPVAQRYLAVDVPDILVDVERFACQRRFVGLERSALDKTSVGRYAVARFKDNDVAHRDFVGRYYHALPGAEHFGVGSVELFQVVKALRVCTVPSIAFMVITTSITQKLSLSPINIETAAAIMSMITMKSANCERKI